MGMFLTQLVTRIRNGFFFSSGLLVAKLMLIVVLLNSNVRFCIPKVTRN